MILCDTNILIEFYKDHEEAVNALRGIGLPNIAVSVVTVGELYFGARDRRELLKIKKHLAGLRQIVIDAETSAQFLSLLETYALSHRLNLPDALIRRHRLASRLEPVHLERKGLSIYRRAFAL